MFNINENIITFVVDIYFKNKNKKFYPVNNSYIIL